MLIRHHNYKLNGSDIPEAVGDRYYAQDLERDFYNQREYASRITEDYLGLYDKYDSNIVINGLTASQGAGHTLSWTAGRVKVTHTLKTPTNWAALPPAMTSHTIPHNIDIPAATDQAITGANTDGVTVNYAKMALNESETSSRTRAKKAGTYNSEVSESYTFTCNDTAPTSSEVAIATFTTNGAAITFTNDEPRWRKYKSVTATYTAKVYDYYIKGSGTFDVDLPAVANAKGQYLCIDNIGTGTLTADPDGAETIEGLSDVDIYPQKKLILYCNGTTWDIINNFEIINSSSTATVTISDSDVYSIYYIPHTSSTGLFTRNLPTLADNIGKEYRFKNLGLGLTKIVSEEGSNILFDNDNSLTNLFLANVGDECIVKATSSGWELKRWRVGLVSGMINRNDWTSEGIGSAFTYDNKSSTFDITGEKGTEEISNNTFLCIHDDTPAGAAGTCYCVNVTGTGIFTNNREVTFGNSETCDVNEASGSSKNIDYDLYHNLNLYFPSFKAEFIISSDGTDANRVYLGTGLAATGAGDFGFTFRSPSANYIELNTAAQIVYFTAPGANLLLDTEDYYGEYVISINR
jgi:hypothetical protein